MRALYVSEQTKQDTLIKEHCKERATLKGTIGDMEGEITTLTTVCHMTQCSQQAGGGGVGSLTNYGRFWFPLSIPSEFLCCDIS